MSKGEVLEESEKDRFTSPSDESNGLVIAEPEGFRFCKVVDLSRCRFFINLLEVQKGVRMNALCFAT
jgi:hypothetical protein